MPYPLPGKGRAARNDNGQRVSPQQQCLARQRFTRNFFTPTARAARRCAKHAQNDRQCHSFLTPFGAYNDAGELLTANDGGYATFAWHTFSYDNLGRVEWSNVRHFQGGLIDAQLDQKHDEAGNRVELKTSARFNGAADYTPDFINSYAYDNLSRMTQVQQTGQGGNVVADKLVNFRYNALSQFTDVDRFKDLAASQQVATADYLYDSLGRLKTLTYSNIPTPYQWTYDTASRVLSFNSQDGLQEYTYNKTSQLTDVKLNGAPTEDHDYDPNGNRTNTGYVTTANNQVQSDGAYNYSYDAEGNRATRAKIGTSEIEYYFWDYRNRLERVLQYNGATPVKFTAHHYDAFDRRIATWVDSTTSDGWENAAIERMVYDGDDVVLDFLDQDGYGGTGLTEQTKRYLHGAAVDQILAQEDPREDFGTVNRVLWHQADNLATVRDLARQDGTIATHFTYDSFGNVTAGDTSLTRYLFTGQEYDLATGLYLYNVRWYDPRIGRFVSEDPIGFGGGDANLSRYVGNAPTNYRDPSGLYKVVFMGKWTHDQVQRVLDSLARVKTKAMSLIKEIDAELKSLSACERELLSPGMLRLRRVLQRMVDGIDSHSEKLAVYHYPEGSDAPASFWNGGLLWVDELRFNDSLGWQNLPQLAFDTLMLHELSHKYGTRDDDVQGELNNAHVIERMMSGTFRNNLFYLGLKKKAKELCACKDAPTDWRFYGPP